jgi:hypothetical protein
VIILNIFLLSIRNTSLDRWCSPQKISDTMLNVLRGVRLRNEPVALVPPGVVSYNSFLRELWTVGPLLLLIKQFRELADEPVFQVALMEERHFQRLRSRSWEAGQEYSRRALAAKSLLSIFTDACQLEVLYLSKSIVSCGASFPTALPKITRTYDMLRIPRDTQRSLVPTNLVAACF